MERKKKNFAATTDSRFLSSFIHEVKKESFMWITRPSFRPSVCLLLSINDYIDCRLFTKFDIGFSLQMSSKFEFCENRHSCRHISLWRCKGIATRHFHTSWTVRYIRCIKYPGGFVKKIWIIDNWCNDSRTLKHGRQ